MNELAMQAFTDELQKIAALSIKRGQGYYHLWKNMGGSSGKHKNWRALKKSMGGRMLHAGKDYSSFGSKPLDTSIPGKPGATATPGKNVNFSAKLFQARPKAQFGTALTGPSNFKGRMAKSEAAGKSYMAQTAADSARRMASYKSQTPAVAKPKFTQPPPSPSAGARR